MTEVETTPLHAEVQVLEGGAKAAISGIVKPAIVAEVSVVKSFGEDRGTGAEAIQAVLAKPAGRRHTSKGGSTGSDVHPGEGCAHSAVQHAVRLEAWSSPTDGQAQGSPRCVRELLVGGIGHCDAAESGRHGMMLALS